MDDILVSDIMGIFNREERFVVRVRRPDGTFIEGEVPEEDVQAFSRRLTEARERDAGAEFDVSMVTEWWNAD